MEMNKSTKEVGWTFLLISACLLFYYGPFLRHPGTYLATTSSDGIKAYAVFAGHIRNDTGYRLYPRSQHRLVLYSSLRSHEVHAVLLGILCGTQHTAGENFFQDRINTRPCPNPGCIAFAGDAHVHFLGRYACNPSGIPI